MPFDSDRRGPETRRIGVFGGTFDPVHNGHIKVALFALESANLDLVLMVPAGSPWLRDEAPTASSAHRLRMVEIAIDGVHGLELSSVDVDRRGETYTADTLTDLRERYEESDRFVLVLGVDAALSMDRWKSADELPKMCDLLVIGRPGELWDSELPDEHPASAATYMEGPMIDVSATEIRMRLSADEGLSGILPEQVERYIRENGLYGVPSAGDGEKRS